MTDIIEGLGYLAGGSRFRRIYEKMQIDGDKAYKEAGFDFKSSWFPVYYVLAKSQLPQTVMEITTQITFSHITVKNIIKELGREQLIKIAPNPNDKRSKLISLSDKGRALSKQLEPLWIAFAMALKNILTSGHPDIINILKRIDIEISANPLNERVRSQGADHVLILDYKPCLKKRFQELARPWLLNELDGALEKEDKFTIYNPDVAYIQEGGFLFFARYRSKIVGCVALKRLDEDTFEFTKLFVKSNTQKLEIAVKLVEKCITRCKENEATQLWHQTTSNLLEAHKLYNEMGFVEKEAPPQMTILKRTKQILCLGL